MDADNYLKERLQYKIDWYDAKSIQNQKHFKRFQVAAIVSSATIPFLSGFITETTVLLKIIVGALGIVIAGITGIIGLYRFQENWIEYRTTCESLKHEKYLYLTKSAPYDVKDTFPLLVERVESLISKKISVWYQFMKKSEDK